MSIKLFSNMQRVKAVLVVTAILIAAASLIVSHFLIRDLTLQEERNAGVWAEAMRSLQAADGTTDLGLVLTVIEGNTTIPVVVLDARGNVIAARNVGVPQDSIDAAIAQTTPGGTLKEELKQRAAAMQNAGHAFRFELSDSTKSQTAITVCYESSVMLRRLAAFPYVQLGVAALFLLVAILALLSSKRAEQNKVWVGLSRETAHQLGTPLSSLMAGSEILKESYPDDPLLPELEKDIQRLQLIAERFSKIGSTPTLQDENLCGVIERVAQYIGRRASDKVRLTTNFPSDHVTARINAPLFEWVIENLCKNAIDAMQGEGSITIYVYTRRDRTCIDISDTGKGIARSHWKSVFKPGFTTKRRGWGLGLSLAKRIVEEYHNGSIYVKNSEPGVGTTFCIELKK